MSIIYEKRYKTGLDSLKNRENILLSLQAESEKREVEAQALSEDPSLAKSILKWVTSTGGNQQDAQDIFQESIFIYLKNKKEGKFKGKSSVKTYVLGIAKNLNYKRLNKTKTYYTDKMEKLPSSNFEEDGETQIIFQEQNKERLKCYKIMMSELDEPCKKALILRDQFGYSIEEIADEMNYTKIQSANNFVHRCRKKLRKLVANNPFILSILKKSNEKF